MHLQQIDMIFFSIHTPEQLNSPSVTFVPFFLFMWIVWPLDGRVGLHSALLYRYHLLLQYRSYFSFIISETEAIFLESLIAYCNPPATLSNKPSSIQC